MGLYIVSLVFMVFLMRFYFLSLGAVFGVFLGLVLWSPIMFGVGLNRTLLKAQF